MSKRLQFDNGKEYDVDEFINEVRKGKAPLVAQNQERAARALSLASHHDQRELYDKLAEAVDFGDMDEMNVLLDAIQLDHQFNTFMDELPDEFFNRLVEYARN